MKLLDEHQSLSLLQDFVRSCAFVHDDTLDELRLSTGQLNYDQFGTNAFFLGAQVCVVDTLSGFGTEYLEYLNRLGYLPADIVVPKHRTPSLLSNLLADQRALDQLRVLAQQRNLNISSFYSDESKPFEILLQELAVGGYDPRLIPSKDIFRIANNKVHMRQLMEQADIAIPEGVVCTSPREVHQVFRINARRGYNTLLKRLHWQAHLIQHESEIDQLIGENSLPIIAERIYPVKSSPVCHVIAWKDDLGVLFCVDQIIDDWRHYGNRLPLTISAKVMSRIVEDACATVQLLPNYEGVCGIDFVVTPEDEVLAVDVNPRFNSSTYPFYLLKVLGIPLTSIHAHFGFVRTPVLSLSHVFTDPSFPCITTDASSGVIMLAPFFDWQIGAVTRFLYIAFASNHEELARVERDLTISVEHCSVSSNT